MSQEKIQEETELSPERLESCREVAASAIVAAAVELPESALRGLRACGSAFINEVLDASPFKTEN